MGTQRQRDDRQEQRFDIPLGDIVPEYRSAFGPVRWLFRKRLEVAASYVAEIAPDVLIDGGCGDGSFLRLLGGRHAPVRELWGLDLNPGVRELNGSVPGSSFLQRSLFETGFPDGAADAVACLDVLEHISDIIGVLQEIRRVLRPGGWLIISGPVESLFYRSLRFLLKGTYSQESGPGAGQHYYTVRQIDAAIRARGFHLIRRRMVPLPAPLDLFHVNLYQRR